MTRPFSIVALFLLGFNSAAASDATFLEAVAQVESGMDRKAVGKAGERGMYQLKKASWDDANALLEAEKHFHFQWSQWRDATAQDMIAAAHLRILRQRFKADGYSTPTPEQLALAWNRGYEGAKSWNFAPNDYALRVANLFHLSTKQGATK
jgi:soluble lytic murein transglycosylase-like protein